jgi:hypothetical protein
MSEAMVKEREQKRRLSPIIPGSSRNFVEIQTEPRKILGYLKASGLENRLFFSELFGVYLLRR